MIISTKGRYTLRMMLDLAEHQKDTFVPLNEIADRQGISKKYLELILISIKGEDIFKVSRGAHGGYMLALPPDQITVGRVLRLTDGDLAPVACLDSKTPCKNSASCLTYPIWKGLRDTIYNYLDNITLQDILDNRAAPSADYMI